MTADVRRLALFPHDLSREDEAIDQIVTLTKDRYPQTTAARDGDCIAL